MVAGARTPGRRQKIVLKVDGELRWVWYHVRQASNWLLYSFDDGDTYASDRDMAFWWAEKHGKLSLALEEVQAPDREGTFVNSSGKKFDPAETT